MSDPGPAQLDLIRRYARTMRELQADAMAARGPRIGARPRRDRPSGDPLRKAAQAMTGPRAGRSSDVTGPTLPVS